MKKIITALLLTVALAACAQPTTNFLQSAQLYFTSVNTNYTFSRFLLWNGMNYQNNVNISDELVASFDVYAPTNCYQGGLTASLEGGMRNSGIAGTVVSGQGGAGLNYNYYDTRIGLYADGGYDDPLHRGFAEVGLRLLKKPTANTFLGTGLGLQFPTTGPQYPLVSVFGGVTF
jgi:hypothetical protein